MSSTNKTEHYSLPQFIGSDIPTWLGDFNSAMTAIDRGINAAATTASGAATDAAEALTDAEAAQNALNAKANTSTLATVESTSTASQAYSVGDYLVYNGILYKVISAIDKGKTLTPNTNIKATTAGAELTSLNEGIVNIGYTVMGNGTTTATKNIALSGYTPFVAIPTGAIGDMKAMTELYNSSVSGNTATFMWSSAKTSSVGIGFVVIYKKNI